MTSHDTAQPSRGDFYRELASRAKRLPGSDSTRALQYFRERIIPDPDALRRTILGANAFRTRALSPRQKNWQRIFDIGPDLLSPIGTLRHELTHSRLIAFHLDPACSRALAPRCTSTLLKRLGHSDDGPFSVTTEHYIRNGRIDIRLESAHTLIFIELKVDSSEGQDQLKRYRTALDCECGDRTSILVYLTATAGEVPSEKPNFHLSFRDLLLSWLPAAEGGLDVHRYLARYLKSLALLEGCAADGRFEDWSFSTQRALLDLLEEMQHE